MVKVAALATDRGDAGGILQRIRPVHYVMLLCMVIIHYEIKSVSRSAREEGDLSVQRLTTSLTTATLTTGGGAGQQEDTTTTTATGAAAAPAASTPDDPTPSQQQQQVNPLITGCTTLQKRLIQKSIPDAQTIIDATKCPDSSAWLTDYLQEASTTEPFVFLNFGCNKGYDSLFMAETISRNTEVFNKQKWAEAIGIGHPGNCYQGASDKNTPVDPNLPKRPVEVHCIEAMPQTAEKLIHAAEITQAKANGLHAYNYAMTGTAGGAPILFPNPTGGAGTEHLGLAHCNDPVHKPECKEVTTKTVDEFVKEHVDITGKAPNRRIPFMSIDVEGFDFTVMKGASETLKRTDYLEFEYHGLGDWLEQKLQDAMIMLKDNGLVCYWSGVNQLWKLTDTCWMDHFEFRMWSNVACVAPKYQPKLAAKMEQVFEDTLVQGKATTT